MKKIVLTIGIMALLGFSNLFAQEAKVQSGLIYHFTKYIQWPANKKSGDFVIGVVGDAELKKMLSVVASAKTVGTQKIVVKSFSSPAECSGCHIIFLSSGKSGQFDAAKSSAKSNKALLITEKSGLGTKGAGINFTNSGGKMSFELNESATNGCGLKVSAKLAALGKKVG